MPGCSVGFAGWVSRVGGQLMDEQCPNDGEITLRGSDTNILCRYHYYTLESQIRDFFRGNLSPEAVVEMLVEPEGWRVFEPTDKDFIESLHRMRR